MRKRYDNIQRSMWAQQNQQKLILPAFGGIALLLLLLGNHISAAALAWPVLAGIALIPIAERCSMTAGLAVYALAAAIALLHARTESSLLFAFIGSYPIWRPRMERTRRLWQRIALKVLLAVAAGLGLLLLFQLTAPELLAEMTASDSVFTGIVFLVAAGLYTFFYDAVLSQLTKFYLRYFPTGSTGGQTPRLKPSQGDQGGY